jgi:hypothetical protein
MPTEVAGFPVDELTRMAQIVNHQTFAVVLITDPRLFVGPLTHTSLRKAAAAGVSVFLQDRSKGTPVCDLEFCGFRVHVRMDCPEGSIYPAPSKEDDDEKSEIVWKSILELGA